MAIFYFFAPLGYFTKSKRGVNVRKKGGQRVQKGGSTCASKKMRLTPARVSAFEIS